MLDGGERFGGDFAAQNIDPRGAHERLFPGGGKGDALRAAVGALIELAGQVLDGKDLRIRPEIGQSVIGHIDLRLGEDGVARGVEVRLVNPLDIVAVDDPHAGHTVEHQGGAQVTEDPGRFDGVFRLFFHIDSINAHVIPSNFCMSSRRKPAAVSCFLLSVNRRARLHTSRDKPRQC